MSETSEASLVVLLEQARRGKVDISRISLSDLVTATLEALLTEVSLAVRGDRLVIAAELVALKARLLLPQPQAEPEAMQLRERLERLAFIRAAGDALMKRDQLGRDIFARGAPEDVTEAETLTAAAAPDLLGLLRAYAGLRLRDEAKTPLQLRKILVMTLREAFERLGAKLEFNRDWAGLFDLARGPVIEAHPRSVAAASLIAALEMARQGMVEIRQREGGEIEIRRKGAENAPAPELENG